MAALSSHHTSGSWLGGLEKEWLGGLQVSTEFSAMERVRLDCQYGTRAQKPYHIGFFGPNFILAVYWDRLSNLRFTGF